MVRHIKNALNVYGRTSIDAEVESASPHKLICLLFEGALKAIQLAKVHMLNRAIEQKGASISKAIAIIEEGLRGSLEHDGEAAQLAENLDALYDYLGTRLLTANLKNDTAILDEVYGILLQIKTAWDAIEKPVTVDLAPANDAAAALKAQRMPLSYGRV